MKVRYQADNDLRQAIVTGLLRRRPAIDFQTARQARFDNVPDEAVLARAAQEGRILVSHDYATMPKQFLAFTAEQPSPGVFLAPQQQPLGPIIQSLELVWEDSEAEEWTTTG
jgi:hypothetical protein